MKSTSCNIFFVFAGYINGSLMDCLNLFVWCKSHNIDIGLRFVDDSDMVTKICSRLYHERYHHALGLPFDEFIDKGIVSVVSYPDLLKMDNMIFFDYNTFYSYERNVFSFTKHTKRGVFVSNLYPDDLIRYYPVGDGCELLYEPEYGFVGRTPYRQKYLLNELAESYEPRQERKKLVVCPGLSEKNFLKIAQEENNLWGEKFEETEYVYREPMKLYPDFLEQISELIYFQSPSIRDRKPVIMLECMKLGIPVQYHRWNQCVDGSFIRHEQGLVGLDDRAYSENDILIRWISER